MKKICIVTTHPINITSFLRPHILELSERYSITIICNLNLADGENLDLQKLPAKIISICIQRKINVISDVFTLVQIINIFLREQFDVVHTLAPKAGLLGIFAAFLTFVPIRIHTFQGEVWSVMSGGMRFLLKKIDQLVASLSTHITVVSPSEEMFLQSQGVIPQGKSRVLGNGSICGVNPKIFYPNLGLKIKIRHELGIPISSKIILFVGRINRDKGVIDLAHSYKQLLSLDNVYLVIVGADEEGLTPWLARIIGDVERVRFLGYSPTPQSYMAAADILCLPSYREGFGMVIIEAGAVGVPSVCSDIYGVQDAVISGVTGLTFRPGNLSELTKKLSLLVHDDELREKLGRNAFRNSLERFSEDRLVLEMASFYESVINHAVKN
ncbi:glycosyltransferase family 4 protein [Polynucleobacter paneuropaeus]|nr:glycosyltransferase family 4 protein [Polynucleobacter paneuropaeus]